MSALTESVAPAVVTGGGHAAQSANLTAIAVAARTGTERRRETGTENGHPKTKVRFLTFFIFCVCFCVSLEGVQISNSSKEKF